MLGKILFKSYTMTAMESYWNTMYVTIRTSFQTSYAINRDPEGRLLSHCGRYQSEHLEHDLNTDFHLLCVLVDRGALRYLTFTTCCVNPEACNHILIFITHVFFQLSSMVKCFHINTVILCFQKNLDLLY